MDLLPDFKELLVLFSAHNVDFVIVGAYSVAFHGAPRATGDLDILVRPTPENATAILDSLEEFGFGGAGLTKKDFETPDCVIQLGVPPVRVDILTSITGVPWETVERGRVKGTLGNIAVYFLGIDELRINKKTLGRKKDLADIEALGED